MEVNDCHPCLLLWEGKVEGESECKVEDIYALFGLEVWESGKLRVWGSGSVKICEENWGCLDWGMLEGMCEESLLKYVSDVMVVRIFWIIFNCVNCKITKLPFYKKEEEINDN